ncbi:hypothetical protein NHX12_012152 [Muraenolepis orangiensis]|uniref:Uncharacterized protein n=1 Tax=Muraenolepis orangiensis TaxID=630683 RepID=A0A9Q0DK93_9TELE|nr:hypothetical protein NHX12_012152 [Muraenolepis orangiensis]
MAAAAGANEPIVPAEKVAPSQTRAANGGESQTFSCAFQPQSDAIQMRQMLRLLTHISRIHRKEGCERRVPFTDTAAH